MDPADLNRNRPTLASSEDAISETQALRRKVVFWRRVAWLALGGAALFLMVVWTRGQARQRECFDALTRFAEVALASQLSAQHPEILEQQWQSFEQISSGIAPDHYDLIVKNWASRQTPGEDLPLAVCRDSHLLLFSSGRHVLRRTESGFRVDWLDEKEATPIAAEARKDNQLR
ncbi:MAG TPA: hypothetical protein VJZ71_15390 [Phycisphaerae bacterium]|nr:hypothetical protein [Phycisphaerae bacterium]